MSEETKVVFEPSDFGIEGNFETKEQALEAVREKWANKEVYLQEYKSSDAYKQELSSKTGAVIGSIKTNISRIAREKGFELGDFDKPEDAFSFALENRPEPKKNDSQLQELMNKNKELATRLESVETEYTQKLEESNNRFETFKKDIEYRGQVKGLFGSIETLDREKFNDMQLKFITSTVLPERGVRFAGEFVLDNEGNKLTKKDGTDFVNAKDYARSIAQEFNLLKLAEKPTYQSPQAEKVIKTYKDDNTARVAEYNRKMMEKQEQRQHLAGGMR